MIVSFGHRYGTPQRVDKTFDVRTLTHNTASDEFKNKYREIVDYGKQNPDQRIAIGCEKGQHRSVVLANKVSSALRTSVYHRDRGRN